MWKIALVGMVLTAGAATPLPEPGINSETGDSMLVWGDYTVEHCNHLVVSSDVDPDIIIADTDTCYVLMWIPSDPVSVPEGPVAQPGESKQEPSGCGKIFSVRKGE